MTHLAARTNAAERRLIESLISSYEKLRPNLELFRDQLMPALAGSPLLRLHVHSMKSRLKDPDHLRDKLLRKLAQAKGRKKPLGIASDNLARKINDLLGVRILHLHTRQIGQIDEALHDVFAEGQFALIEGPVARTWDDESRSYFKECGIRTQKSPSMYTSVHYVIGSKSRTKMTAEIQVRTLSEEVWGEVDHSMNYPHETDSLPCREQLKVLARVTSSATRLVDSVFLTIAEHQRKKRARGVTAQKQVAQSKPTRRIAKPMARHSVGK